MNPRLKKLFASFGPAGIDGLLVSSWPNVSYLSGFKGTESWILVSPKGLYFLTDSRYSEQAENEARGFKVVLRDKRGVAEIAADLSRKMKLKRVGYESAVVTHDFYLGLAKHFGADKLVPARDLVENLRLIKDASEARLLRRSAAIAVKGFHHVRKTARPGMTERGLQAELEYYTKKLGAEKPAFDIIIATGERASMPHCQTNETRVKNNNVLLVDMGVVYKAYHSDLTRPVFLGKISPKLKEIHQVVWDAQRAGIAKAGPGVPAKDVDAACREHIRRAGYAEFFGHGTGHGVGLEIHEAPTVSPRSRTILKPGMVITVEPGIYLPGRFGIRIEDELLITDKGCEVLTRGLD